jgi:hypothetical protein
VLQHLGSIPAPLPPATPFLPSPISSATPSRTPLKKQNPSKWSEEHNFYDKKWRGKHNNGVPLFISHLVPDLPIMRGSAVYNWQQNPIITRSKDE